MSTWSDTIHIRELILFFLAQTPEYGNINRSHPFFTQYTGFPSLPGSSASMAMQLSTPRPQLSFQPLITVFNLSLTDFVAVRAIFAKI